jgi:hypothetical protein
MKEALFIAVIMLLLAACSTKAVASAQQELAGNVAAPGSAAHAQLELHLYGGDLSPGAPLAPWYKNIGVTDVWLYSLEGAFPQDQEASDQRSVAWLAENGVLQAYRDSGLGYWWFERPVPDYTYFLEMARRDADSDVIWGTSKPTEARWLSICAKVKEVYAEARAAGFKGIVYDNEAYYSYRSPSLSWLWEGHTSQLGPQGGYYRRGLQVGAAISSVWPRAQVIMVYGHGYPGEGWWYQGFHDAGIDLYIGVEHTYGAGPPKLGDQWYQHWYSWNRLKGVVRDKRNRFSFIADNRHIISGLFPIDFSSKLPNYDLRYFRQQLEEASSLSGPGPFAVWLWPQGPFTPESWKEIAFGPAGAAEAYWSLMKEFSCPPAAGVVR